MDWSSGDDDWYPDGPSRYPEDPWDDIFETLLDAARADNLAAMLKELKYAKRIFSDLEYCYLLDKALLVIADTNVSGGTKHRANTVKFLLDQGAYVHTRDEYGETVLHKPRLVCVVKILVQYGANIHARNSYGTSVLTHARRCEKPKVVAFLEQAFSRRRKRAVILLGMRQRFVQKDVLAIIARMVYGTL